MYELTKETPTESPPKRRLRRHPGSFLPLRVRVEFVCERPPEKPVRITSPADIYAFLREHAARWDRERFLTADKRF